MVHCYKNNGLNIVMDINSGSVHVVDEKAYEVISMLNEDKSRDEIKEALKDKYSDIDNIIEEVDKLIESKQLFTEDNYKDYIDDIMEKKAPVVKALCLHIAHDCNLACKYCFADEGEYHGQKRELMSYEVGKQALDFLVANSGNRRNLEVDFFGGEPLLNFDVVKKITAYGRSLEEKHNKKFRFTLTTNGVLLNDEVIDFANREMSNVVLSIDGRKEIHDAMRPFRKGQGSYDYIVPKYQKFVKERGDKSYYIRGTFTKNNLDFSKDVEHFIDLGFRKLSIEPVVTEETNSYALTEKEVPQICEEYDKLAKLIIEKKKLYPDLLFFHYMIDLTGGPCVAKRLSGCGSGTEYLAVTPTGELYPCHQFVGNTPFKMGDVFKGIERTDLVDKFKRCNVYSKKECEKCFAKFYCSGGCAANAFNFSGDINGNHKVSCELERKRVECAIMIKAYEAMNK